jgi:hypothetical protein
MWADVLERLWTKARGANGAGNRCGATISGADQTPMDGCGFLWSWYDSTALADGVGFEPTNPCGLAVFKTAALSHSATHPCISNLVRANCSVDLCIADTEFRSSLTYLAPRRFIDGNPGLRAVLRSAVLWFPRQQHLVKAGCDA